MAQARYLPPDFVRLLAGAEGKYVAARYGMRRCKTREGMFLSATFRAMKVARGRLRGDEIHRPPFERKIERTSLCLSPLQPATRSF